MRWIGSETFCLTRLVYQRCLALILLLAFLNAAFEFKPLLGEHGLLPVPLFTKAVPFSSSPSLFFLAPNDTAFTLAAWLGVLLACLALTGLADRYRTWLSMLVWAALWVPPGFPCSCGPRSGSSTSPSSTPGRSSTPSAGSPSRWRRPSTPSSSAAAAPHPRPSASGWCDGCCSA